MILYRNSKLNKILTQLKFKHNIGNNFQIKTKLNINIYTVDSTITLNAYTIEIDGCMILPFVISEYGIYYTENKKFDNCDRDT